MISTMLTIESKWNSRLSLRINLCFFLDPRSTMISIISAIKMSEVHLSLLDWICLFKINRRDHSRTHFDRNWVEFTSLCTNEFVFCRSHGRQWIRIINFVDRRWVRFTSLSRIEWICLFQIHTSTMISTIPAIKRGSSSLLSSRMNLNFLDQSSTMI